MRIIIFVLLMLPAVLFAQDSNFEDMKRLAEQGEADAQFDLGLMYDNGRGVPENNAEAVKWYRLSTEQGNEFAQLNLGLMYDSGDGVPENSLTSYVWMSVIFGDDYRFRGWLTVVSLM